MKTVTTALASHLLEPLTTMARCVRIQWQDGTVLGFTSLDVPLTIEGEIYTPVPGMQDFALQTTSSMAVDNTDILGAIDDDAILASDIEAGKWDFAEVRFFEVNWQDLTQGQLRLRRGWVGEIRLARGTYIAEIRGLTQLLVREIGDIYQVECQADLGDSRCKVNLAAFTVTGTVTSPVDRRTFTDTSRTEAERWFDGGVLTWGAGSANSGKRMEVEFYNGAGSFVLFLQMEFPIQVGDTYSVTSGCNKAFSTCHDKYANTDNYRGYNTVGTSDALLQYPNSHV